MTRRTSSDALLLVLYPVDPGADLSPLLAARILPVVISPIRDARTSRGVGCVSARFELGRPGALSI